MKNRIITKTFNKNKEIAETKKLAVIEYPDTILTNYEKYQWHSEKYKDIASNQLENVSLAVDLGLKNQAILYSKEVIETAFKDYRGWKKLEAKEITLRPLTDNFDTGLYGINNSLDLWYMHPLDSKSVKLPTRGLRIIDSMRNFPQVFIQDMKILEAVKRNSVKVKDYRFTGEKPYISSSVIILPDPILATKVADRWYSLLEWEK